MNRLLISFGLAFISYIMLAQTNTFPSSGNVGIGTIAPAGKLQVFGSTYVGNENGGAGFRVSIGGSGGNYGSIGYGYKYTGTSYQHTYAVTDYASQIGFDVGGFTFRTAPQGTVGSPVTFSDVMIIKQNGYVGIGTANPQALFQVNEVRPILMKNNGGNGVYGSELGFNAILNTSIVPNQFKKLGGTGQYGGAVIVTDYWGNIMFQMHDGNSESESVVNFSPQIIFSNNGNVGIGTTNPDYKLTVNGKIKAEEIQVVVDVPADYVFDHDYKLTPLEDLEKYVSEYKHLPGVPNAEQIRTDGWRVGEMNNKLLEKIEEITLYLIEMRKENNAIKIENTDLKNRLELLEKRIE